MPEQQPDNQYQEQNSDPFPEAGPARSVRTGVQTVLRQFLALLGLFLIAIAIPIAFLTPILPIGLPIAIFGVVLLGRNSLWGRRWMEGVLDRHPRVERFAPNWLMRAVFGREKRAS